MIYDITPVPKPRLTRQGKATDRAKKYYKFANDFRLLFGSKKFQPHGESIIFHVPMPKSWSKHKKEAWDVRDQSNVKKIY